MMNFTRLGDLVEITNGYAFKSSEYISEGIRVVRISNVQKGKIEDYDPKFYPNNTINDLNRYRIDENDILMSLTGNVGRVGLFPSALLPAYVNQRVCRIKPTTDKLYNKYLFYILDSDQFEFDAVNNSSGIAQLNLSTKWVEDYLVPLPPLETQKKIAAILDKADELKQNDKKILEKYDQLAQSVFLEMFGDPFINPKRWKERKFSEIVFSDKIITYGIVQAGPNIPEGIPYIRTGDIVNGIILENQLLRTSKQIAKSYERSKCATGDIIMSIRATVGTIAILPDTLNGVNLTQGTARISVNPEIANPMYIFYAIKSNGIQKKINHKTKGATFKEITLGRLRAVSYTHLTLPTILLV